MTILIATFIPQANINDNAIDVDPEGDSTWDVTEAFNALDNDYRSDLLDEIESDGQALDSYDELKDDPNAPAWVREWQGPFSLYVSRKDEK